MEILRDKKAEVQRHVITIILVVLVFVLATLILYKLGLLILIKNLLPEFGSEEYLPEEDAIILRNLCLVNAQSIEAVTGLQSFNVKLSKFDFITQEGSLRFGEALANVATDLLKTSSVELSASKKVKIKIVAEPSERLCYVLKADDKILAASYIEKGQELALDWQYQGEKRLALIFWDSDKIKKSVREIRIAQKNSPDDGALVKADDFASALKNARVGKVFYIMTTDIDIEGEPIDQSFEHTYFRINKTRSDKAFIYVQDGSRKWHELDCQIVGTSLDLNDVELSLSETIKQNCKWS